MKKNLFIILCSLLCVTMAKAEEQVLNFEVNDAYSYFEKEKAKSPLHSLTENTSSEENFAKDNNMEIEGVKTYKNWLGEECIDFGDAPKMYYNWKRDVTYAGIPLFISSFIIKSQKKAFRSARFAMDENWKSKIDDYSQFFPYLPVVGLKALGYDGRSSWDRLIVSAGLSNAVMATIVNATKYSVKEMRPDNSQANSFPSGHTATAFTAATILHKEYGLTRSPWFSVGGYAVAMGTGFMRVLNNRHWISDVVAGAGIGILSTELGYFLTDLLYKNNGITRKELVNITNPNHPSFFDIQLGIAMHKNTMTANYDDGDVAEYELGTSSVVGVEGAYFFNKYLGIGGIARVTTTPIKGLGLSGDEAQGFAEFNTEMEKYDMPGIYNINASNTNLIDGSFDIGLYGNLPLNKHFSLGAKFLVGSRVNGGFEYKGTVGYKKQAFDTHGNPIFTGTIMAGSTPTDWSPVYVFENADGSTFVSNETLMPGVSTAYNFHLDESRYKSDEYTLSKLTGKASFNYVFGLSLRYNYKNNFAWKVFIDYDSAKNNYDWKFNIFDDKTTKDMIDKLPIEPGKELTPEEIIYVMRNKFDSKSSFSSRFNLFTVGAAFSISF